MSGFLVFLEDKASELLIRSHIADVAKHGFDAFFGDHFLEAAGRFIVGVVIAQGQGDSVDDSVGDDVFRQA